jgi:phosphoribosylformylglycinamidine cyclo-ligase
LTLARRALLDVGGLSIEDRPEELAGVSVGQALLEPTVIYVRAVLELLRSDIPVHGLAHITGGGVLNLLRLGRGVGYEIDSPLPVAPIFSLIAERGSVAAAEMWEVFNMGCGFCVMLPQEHAGDAVSLLAAHHPGTGVIGRLTAREGEVSVLSAGLTGGAAGLKQRG